MALSPEGTQVALGKIEDRWNIWLLDLSRGASTRFTFGSAIDSDPVWSPDGRRIIFSSNRDGSYNLYQKQVSGVKDEEIVLKSSDEKYATSWSHDGRFLLYESRTPQPNFALCVLPLKGDKKPIPFAITQFSESDARFSPDGHWVAYTSDESGQPEIYVRSFAMNAAGTAVEAGSKWHVSNGPGVLPRWRGDGRELYYLTYPEGPAMAVETATAPVFRPGTPRSLGTVGPVPREWPNSEARWDSAADGKRFLALAPVVGKPEPFTVVLNWQSGLKK